MPSLPSGVAMAPSPPALTRFSTCGDCALRRDCDHEPDESGDCPRKPVVPAARSPSATRDTESKPQVVVSERDLDELTQETEALFAVSQRDDPRVFRHGSELVRVAENPPRIEALDEHRLRFELAGRLAFASTTRRGLSPCAPPLDLVRNIIADPAPHFPELRALRVGAAFDGDGVLVSRPGYDSASGFFIVGALDVPCFDGSAREGLEYIERELFSDFPFEGPADRAGALAFLLHAFLRSMTGRGPIHGIEAPVYGAGKDLLAETVFLAAYGEGGFSTLTVEGDDDETRKRLTSAAREGRPGLVLGNVTRGLEGASLAAFVTGPWSDRILGSSRIVTFDTETVLVSTGVNVALSSELLRRYVRIRLNPRAENPEERTGFRHPQLREWTLAHRGEILAAVARIVEEWTAAGRPAKTAHTLGSFERWAGLIGSILDFVGVEGFLEGRRELRAAADREGESWRDFVSAWAERFGEAEVTSGDLLPLAQGFEALPVDGKTERAAQVRFGSALRKMRGRVLAGYEVELLGRKKMGAALYRLVNLCECGNLFHDAAYGKK